MNSVEYRNAYCKLNYDRMTIIVPKGSRELIKAEARRQGLSLNRYIESLIPKHLIVDRNCRKKDF